MHMRARWKLGYWKIAWISMMRVCVFKEKRMHEAVEIVHSISKTLGRSYNFFFSLCKFFGPLERQIG